MKDDVKDSREPGFFSGRIGLVLFVAFLGAFWGPEFMTILERGTQQAGNRRHNQDQIHDQEFEQAGAFAQAGPHPVFKGLEASRLSGRDIAAIVGVSPPTVSKWKAGRRRVPAATLVFLTLLLANWLEDLENMVRMRTKAGQSTNAWRTHMDQHISCARSSLNEQEEINTALPGKSVSEGARLFRDWWSSYCRPSGSPSEWVS